ncbi:hypothetical protein K488DRAFT_73552 [Vararia minispora EC-137]|uniref:Uncharacterized protein n=1 Tax=Vararia minispora EC-137 TaxID=1314806 RepID=A0ACB8QA74_9AGAM|nr:hypothetical protein K488DRAFT_73552 [Vararia minispora EC-137]
MSIQHNDPAEDKVSIVKRQLHLGRAGPDEIIHAMAAYPEIMKENPDVFSAFLSMAANLLSPRDELKTLEERVHDLEQAFYGLQATNAVIDNVSVRMTKLEKGSGLQEADVVRFPFPPPLYVNLRVGSQSELKYSTEIAFRDLLGRVDVLERTRISKREAQNLVEDSLQRSTQYISEQIRIELGAEMTIKFRDHVQRLHGSDKHRSLPSESCDDLNGDVREVGAGHTDLKQLLDFAPSNRSRMSASKEIKNRRKSRSMPPSEGRNDDHFPIAPTPLLHEDLGCSIGIDFDKQLNRLSHSREATNGFTPHNRAHDSPTLCDGGASGMPRDPKLAGLEPTTPPSQCGSLFDEFHRLGSRGPPGAYACTTSFPPDDDFTLCPIAGNLEVFGLFNNARRSGVVTKVWQSGHLDYTADRLGAHKMLVEPSVAGAECSGGRLSGQRGRTAKGTLAKMLALSFTFRRVRHTALARPCLSGA